MPSLMPNTAGAKEAYGIVSVDSQGGFRIPPPACKRYGLEEGTKVFVLSSKKNIASFAVMQLSKAKDSVFSKFTDSVQYPDTIYEGHGRTFFSTSIKKGKVYFPERGISYFHIDEDTKLLAVKSTRLSLSLTDVNYWKGVLMKHGFHEAIEAMKSLDEF